MSELIAVTFDDAEQGPAALKSIRALEHDNGISLEDTAVIVKDADGKVKVHNEASSGTETGAVVGGILGGALFLFFPIIGIVAGAVAGGLIGRAAKPGIDGKFVKEVSDDLPAGGSALFVLTKSSDPGMLIAALRQYHGRIRQTSLDEEAEKALEASLK
jgi:uncharacterized membrane protein